MCNLLVELSNVVTTELSQILSYNPYASRKYMAGVMLSGKWRHLENETKKEKLNFVG